MGKCQVYALNKSLISSAYTWHLPFLEGYFYIGKY